MKEAIIRNVKLSDLDGCLEVEVSGFPQEEAASRETIQNRIEIFPQGFLVAELGGRIIGMLNSTSTNREDIADQELKKMVGYDPDGGNMIVFALAVLPEYRKRGVARRLMLRFIEESRRLGKGKILLMCKSHLIGYYERMGFAHIRLSKSTYGGAEWHEMSCSIRERIEG
jgi:ribosomal protein S18 acetylase RimI-like enzyme